MAKVSNPTKWTDKERLEFIKSPEFNVMLDKYAVQEKARKRRAKIAWDKWQREFIKNVIKKGKFDEWMSKMVKDHNDSYKMRLMSKSIQPHPNRNLSRTFSFAAERGSKIKSKRKLNKNTPNEFTTSLVEYCGYYFHIVHGQGVGYSVLKKDKKGGKIENIINL